MSVKPSFNVSLSLHVFIEWIYYYYFLLLFAFFMELQIVHMKYKLHYTVCVYVCIERRIKTHYKCCYYFSIICRQY